MFEARTWYIISKSSRQLGRHLMARNLLYGSCLGAFLFSGNALTFEKLWVHRANHIGLFKSGRTSVSRMCLLCLIERVSPVFQYTLPVPPPDLVRQDGAALLYLRWGYCRAIQWASAQISVQIIKNNASSGRYIHQEQLLFPLVFLFCSGHLSWSACSGKKRETPLQLIY